MLDKASFLTSIRLDDKIAAEIKEYATTFGKKTASDAIRDLVKIGITIVKNRSKVETQEQLNEIEKELQHGDLVTYFEKMDQRQYDALWRIIKDENDIRFGKVWRNQMK